MRKIKYTTFFVLTLLIINYSIAFADVNNTNDVNITNLSSKSQELYHEKDSVVEVFNYSNKELYLKESDIYLMSQIVYAESRGEPYEGKVAVASVILNRLVDSRFPNTIEGVIKQKNAFSCVHNNRIDIIPTEECRNAVLDALNGHDPTSRAVFFYNPTIATSSWMKDVKKTNVKSIGHHVFFQVKY